MTGPFDRPPWYLVDFGMEISDPRLRDVYRYWRALGDGDDLPRADRFDPLDLVSHLGHLFVVHVEIGAAGGPDLMFRYALIGTRLVEVLGRDTTGQLVEDTFPPDHPVLGVYRQIVSRRVPVRTHGRLDWVDKEYRRFESVLLPMTGPDGRIAKVIGAALYRTADDSFVGT